MSFLQALKLWLSPPKIVDPVFGKLVFMHNEKRPEESYWEGRWNVPGSKCCVEIFLPGGEKGPNEDSLRFYLALPGRIEQIMEHCRPALAKAFGEWLNRDLPNDLFHELKLASFNVDDPSTHPLNWSVSFETTGEKWLGITIPFIDDAAGEAEVDT